MQTVQSLKDGIWNLPNTVTSFLAKEEVVLSANSDDSSNNNNNNGSSKSMTNSDVSGKSNPDQSNADDITDKSDSDEVLVEEGVTLGTSSSVLSSDESSLERSHAIPYALIKEQWQLVLDQEETVTIPQMESAIQKCKDLVLQTTEDSIERKWLVRHLIELRHRLRELQDVDSDPDAEPPDTRVILGHHFVKCGGNSSAKRKLHCDHCAGIIWNVMQPSYVCADCSFVAHHKCIPSVIRICAHVITTERNRPIECICPEIGLAFQKYTCAECGTQLSYSKYAWNLLYGIQANLDTLLATK
ncbi:differentially expressed in FDCP 8 homolog [Aedes albopictus]|uniref:Phorbol-ester/DAG-type domain-containing protein n=1 Tax=Aedes albopictus TaxID=7160 RepID=A0ABM1ZEN4_AEDAL